MSQLNNCGCDDPSGCCYFPTCLQHLFLSYLHNLVLGNFYTLKGIFGKNKSPMFNGVAEVHFHQNSGTLLFNLVTGFV